MNFSKIAKMLLSFSLLCCFCLSANVLTEADFQKAQAMKNGKVYVDQTTKAETNDVKSLGDIEIKNDVVKTKKDQIRLEKPFIRSEKPFVPHNTTRDCVDTNYDADGNVITDGWDGCADYVTSWCGVYDTADFNSLEMCCICGGGEDTDGGGDPDPYENCTGNAGWAGDGYCDGSNNNADCLYDGGDCCPSTCVDGAYSCASNGGDCDDCIDPAAEDSNGGGSCASAPVCGDGVCEDGEAAGDAGCYADCGCVEGEVDCGAAEDGFYGNCIPGSWACDGLADCNTGADEADCGPSFTCGDGVCEDGEAGGDAGCYADCGCLEGEFDCGAAEDGWYGNCISGGWACDGYADCNTEADEADCGAPPTCEELGLWDCGDGQCINPSYVCDGSLDTCNAGWGPDCANGADESLATCGEDHDECIADACVDCVYDWTAYGSECCDTAFGAFGLDCATLEANYGWDCSGCACPGDPVGVCGDGTCQWAEDDTSCPDDCQPDPYANCTGNANWASDGWCDASNNNADCLFDGGDCCPSTCVDGTYSCASYGGTCDDCIDPDAEDSNYGGSCTPPATCEDEAACNTGAEGDCNYPATGYNCDGTVADGYHVDCAGTLASDYYLSYIGDGWCDGVDAAYGVNYQCCEFNFDNGDCGDAIGCDGTALECGGASEDCAGECGGSAELDECGECAGDGYDAGDFNSDCGLDVLDVIALVNAVVDGSDIAGGDLNGDDATNVIDVVVLVNLILGSGRTADADTAMINTSDNSVSITADGYIGGVQMTLSHDNGFEINLTDNALVAEYRTEGTSTILVVVAPEGDVLFTTNKSFEIVDMIVANSTDEIEVNTITDFGLSAAYPNPFNPSTTVSLTVPSADYVSVKVYNLMGQVVGVLADGMMEANVYSFTWDASNMSSGVYLVKAESSSSVDIQKVLLVK